MSNNSAGGNILKNGATGNTGRSGPNNITKVLKILQEDNLRSLYELQLKMAKEGDKPELRNSAQQFLLSKALPNATPCTRVTIELKNMECIADIKENELTILEKVGEGLISLEEGDKLLSMTEKVRKTFEVADIEKKVAEMDARMISKGI